LFLHYYLQYLNLRHLLPRLHHPHQSLPSHYHLFLIEEYPSYHLFLYLHVRHLHPLHLLIRLYWFPHLYLQGIPLNPRFLSSQKWNWR
jgi:hypothetical protein